MKKLFAALILLLIAESSYASFYPKEVLNSLTLREKIGQLFIIRPDQLDTRLTPFQMHHDSTRGIIQINNVMLETLKKYPAGGFALFSKNINNPEQLRTFTSDLRKSCKIVPVMAIDEEGGRISRVANHKNFHVKKFTSTQEIGTSGLAYEAGVEIAKYLKDYGFNMNFAPVADVNTNPENIVIGDRAFSNKPEVVSECVSKYLDGIHSQGIAGSIKHFPGHGDTKDDTHTGFVAVSKTWEELLKAELVPFIANLEKADSVMIAHITLKNITSDNLPATLSHEIITEKLREELNYDGVVIADALMMGAITKHYTSAEAAVLALEAGCDILLMPYNYAEAFEGIIEAVNTERISESRINESVLRILRLKERM